MKDLLLSILILIQIHVYGQAPVISSQPSNQTSCNGNTTKFSISANGATSYQWQEFITSWTNITNSAIFSGVTTDTLTIINTTSLNGKQYRCYATNTNGTTFSNSATLTSTISGTWLGAISSSWKNPDNWCGGIPSPTTNVIINAGSPHMPVLDTIGYCFDITIASGASLLINNNTSTLYISATFTKNGVLSHSRGTIQFNGSSSQTIPGGNYWNVEVNNGTGITILDTITLSEVTAINGMIHGCSKMKIMDYGLISRTSNGFLDATPIPIDNYSINYLGLSQITTSFEMISSSPKLFNLQMVNNGGLILDRDVFVNNAVVIGSSMTIGNHKLTINGDLQGNGILVGGSGSKIVYGPRGIFNSGDSTILPSVTVDSLILNRIKGIVLNGNVIVRKGLTFQNGKIHLRNYNLTLDSSNNSINGYSSTNFIITDSIGSLNIRNIGSGGNVNPVIFPVGSSLTSYSPLVLSNTGTSDEFRVRVLNGVYGGYNGSWEPTNSKIINNAVGKTWIMNEGVSGGSYATVTLQWNSLDELPGFIRSSSYLSSYNGSSWTPTAVSAASGTNPYYQTRTGITTPSAFGIGSNGILPVNLISFKAEEIANGTLLKWQTANEKNNLGFEIQRGQNINDFEKIGFVNGQNSNISITYSYRDFNIDTQNKSTFYRLKQIDFDGKSSYSEILTIEREPINNSRFHYWPTIVNKDLYFNDIPDGEYEIVFYNQVGGAAYNAHFNTTEGTYVLDLGTLNNGIYYCFIKGRHLTKSFKVIKDN